MSNRAEALDDLVRLAALDPSPLGARRRVVRRNRRVQAEVDRALGDRANNYDSIAQAEAKKQMAVAARDKTDRELASLRRQRDEAYRRNRWPADG